MKKNETIITTIIGRGAECEAGFSAKGSVRIDGVVNGDVQITDNLIVGITGKIFGNISAKSVIIGGEVIGNVNAPERAELTGTAKLIGDLTTAVIVIDEKAVFQGTCNMNQEASTKRVRPAGKAVRTNRKSAKAAIVDALREVEEENRSEAEVETEVAE